MSDEEDKKIQCKYGAKCYQKNPAHHAKYKHPKKRSRSPEDTCSKRPKVISKEDIEDKSLEFDDNQLSDLVDKVEMEELNLDLKKKYIKQFFLVDMPKDFYYFWEFCQELNKDDPKQALKLINLELVGPFDILACEEIKNKDDKHLLHWRYYYDPPEFQTIIKGDDKTQYHMGYFRDDPEEMPCFVAENHAKRNCIIKPIGETIFGALNTHLCELIKKADPFTKMGLTKLLDKLKTKAKQLNFDISIVTSSMQKRNRSSVAKTFHSAGIVAPYDKKTDVGYRSLNVSEKELVRICDKIAKCIPENKSKVMSEIQPVITGATIAIDECDFGTGLELGIDLFCYGHENLDGHALRMLTSAYSVLSREPYIEILKVHLENRKKEMPYVVKYQ